LKRESKQARRSRAESVLAALAELYPDSRCSLDHDGPLQLLVATVLSAQCTDAAVNRATPSLFARYRTAAGYAGAGQEEMEDAIRSINFYRNKAKSLIGLGRALVERHGGEVPADLDALTALPGVGRKTANVVLNTAFGQPTVAVDTHIFRVANHTGLAPGKDPREVDDRLVKFTPPEFLKNAHHWLILHGRYVCIARKPGCPECLIRDLCEYRQKTKA
jgi:endonuclease III